MQDLNKRANDHRGLGITTGDGRGDSSFYLLLRNLRYAGRHLTQNPGFTSIAVLSLALGIGANCALFSLVNAIILKDLPFENPDELVNIYMRYPGSSYNPFSYPDR